MAGSRIRSPPVPNLRIDKPAASTSEMSRTLPPELMAEASWRLGWLGLIYAVACLLGHFGERALLMLTGSIDQGAHTQDVFLVATVAMGIAVFVVSRRGRLAPRQLLNVGLVFQVAGAFGISMIEFWEGVPGSTSRSPSFRPSASGSSRSRSSCPTRRAGCWSPRCSPRQARRWRWRSRRR